MFARTQDGLTVRMLRRTIGSRRANLSNLGTEGSQMRLTFLGKETQGGGSPTLYATDREPTSFRDGRCRTSP